MRALLLVLLLALPTFAQSKGEMVTKYLADWNGYPLEAAVFQRYVDIQADTDWWIYLCTNRTRKSNGLFDLAGSLVTMANNQGWGDAKTLNENSTGQADTPPVLAMLDSWKGKMGVKIVLPEGLKPEQKDELMDNLAILNGPVGSLPRGAKFFLNVKFNPKAGAATGQVSKDGTTYDFVFPTFARVYTSQIENVLKR